MPDLLPIQKKRMPLFEDIFRPPTPVMSPIQPGVGGVPRPLFGDSVPAPETPSLFAPEDVAAARRAAVGGFGAALLENSGWGRPVGSVGTGQALGAAFRAGNEGYRGGLKDAAGTRMAMQAQQLRQRIAQQYPEVPGETSEQTIRRLEKIFAALVAGGDTEGAGKIGEVLKSYGGNRAATTQKPTAEWKDFGGEEWLIDPITRLPILGADGKPTIHKKTPNPRDPNAPDTAQQMRDIRLENLREKYTDDYNKDTTAFRISAHKLREAASEKDAALAGDGAAQMNILYAFIAGLDPQSAVKEGEVALARAAAPFWEQANLLFQKYLSGESVLIPHGLISRMTDLMERRYKGYDSYIKDRAEYYKGRANDNKVYRENLFPTLPAFRSSPAAVGATTTTAAGTPSPILNLPTTLFPQKPTTPP